MPRTDAPSSDSNTEEHGNENTAPDRTLSVDHDVDAAMSFYTGLRSVFEASDKNHDSQLTEKEIDDELQSPSSLLDESQHAKLQLMKDYFKELSAISPKNDSITSGDLERLGFMHLSIDLNNHFADEAKEYGLQHFDEMDLDGDGILKGDEIGKLTDISETHADDLKHYLSRYRYDIAGHVSPDERVSWDQIEMSRENIGAITGEGISDRTIMDLYKGSYKNALVDEAKEQYDKANELLHERLQKGDIVAGMGLSAMLAAWRLADAPTQGEANGVQAFQQDNVRLREFLNKATDLTDPR